eukprot:Opistho-1_new@51629
MGADSDTESVFEPIASLSLDPPTHPWGYAAGDIIGGEVLVHAAVNVISCNFLFRGKELAMWRDDGGRLHKARRTFLSKDYPIQYAERAEGVVLRQGDVIPFVFTIPHDLPFPTLNFPKESEAFGSEIYYVGKVVMLVRDEDGPISLEDEELKLYLTIRAKQDVPLYRELSLRQAWIESKKKLTFHTGSVDFRIRLDRQAIAPTESLFARIEVHNNSGTATVDTVEVALRQRVTIKVNASDVRVLTSDLFHRKVNIGKGVTPGAIADISVPIVWSEEANKTHDMGFDISSELIAVSYHVVVHAHVPWARAFDITVPLRVLPDHDLIETPQMTRRNSLRSKDMLPYLQPSPAVPAQAAVEETEENCESEVADASDTSSVSSSELGMSWNGDDSATDGDFSEQTEDGVRVSMRRSVEGGPRGLANGALDASLYGSPRKMAPIPQVDVHTASDWSEVSPGEDVPHAQQGVKVA